MSWLSYSLISQVFPEVLEKYIFSYRSRVSAARVEYVSRKR